MRNLYAVRSMEIWLFFLGMHKFLWLGLAFVFFLCLFRGTSSVGDLGGFWSFQVLQFSVISLVPAS